MKKALIATAAAVLLAASFQIGAQQSAPTRPAEARARADALLTQEERDQFREKMRATKTREERAEINKEMRATMEQRAREKGITLPQRREAGPRRGPSAAQLFTPEERTQYRDKMRAAQTPEERAEIQKQMRSLTNQRAKEKGLKPPHRSEGGPGKEGRRPQLFTPEERLQHRDQMRAAKTPEERAALRKQLRELTEKRAKEKGVALRERRGRGEPGSGPAN